MNPKYLYALNILSLLLTQVNVTDESPSALQQKEAPFIWDTAAEAYWKIGKTEMQH